MKVLSLFDGMGCGMLAMIAAGIPVEAYDAYEIDKYAIKASTHNFPEIRQHGDVFEADFTAYAGYDFLVGGSPCTYWSIAQSPDKRETTASGLGWELFSQYVRALHEAQPRFFIYENNKSMSTAIRESISESFGFEPVCINSALVSAQNRQRLYWVGVRNPDGTYRKAAVPQPEDRGILLRDILDSAIAMHDKSYCLVASISKQGSLAGTLEKHRHERVAEPACDASRGRNPDNPSDRTAGAPTEQRFEAHEDGKTNTLTTVGKDNLVAEPAEIPLRDKMHTLDANCWRTPGAYNPEKQHSYARHAVAVPVPTALQEQPFGRARDSSGKYDRRFEAKTDNKSAALTSVAARRLVAGPVPAQAFSMIGDLTDRRAGTNDKAYCLAANPSSDMSARVIEPAPTDGRELTEGEMAYMVRGHGERRWNHMQRPGEDEKGHTLTANASKGVPYNICAEPAKGAGRVYEVRDGQIEVNGRRYPIRLHDGLYTIRMLTVSECKRLQTVPEWYDFSCVSKTQALKMLGNGWTVEVIAHLIRHALRAGICGI